MFIHHFYDKVRIVIKFKHLKRAVASR